ncbi:anti-sigma factor RsrA [Thermopolyspora flexuosa]|jgi:mycothiol system anti-sigma-R factor|uniref:Mycothiol system anti-sigma-R factor n=1 Tax=Thermopolyspora flexuosa TaxID=103836 RepID=A0A543ITI1_9ACTN|nr:mycothiol system anti-sigma-R factor [Thermopolyspora flexuosa]TQM73884.1 mycothiol system anti-sigma-R factor [Thermopolyspora flexuosa]GGM95615.1 anti-sigma factor RsrA [Thermopolyspora flexuosa]
MSCGNPHETDCADVLDRLYAYLDGELDETLCGDIRKHLDECGPCLKEYGLDQMVKKLVAKHCGCDPVPEDLRARVMSRIEQVRLEMVEAAESERLAP